MLVYLLPYILSNRIKDVEFSLNLPWIIANFNTRKKRRYILEFMNTRLPGTYELKNAENVVAKFVVLPSLSESILEKITEEQIKSASGAIHDNIIRIDGKMEKDGNLFYNGSRRKFGRETWQILLPSCAWYLWKSFCLENLPGHDMNSAPENIRLLWAGEWPLWRLWYCL